MTQPLVRVGALCGALAVGAACDRTEHAPVDLHLDILAAPPETAATIRLCNEGGVAAEYGATLVGSYVLTGLFAGVAPTITVDALGSDGAWLGRAGPMTIDGAYATTTWSMACSGDGCSPCSGCRVGAPSPGWPSCGEGQAPQKGEEDVVLGVRFAGEDLPIARASAPRR